jgi:hypothetical protein
MNPIVPTTTCWALLALFGTGHAVENRTAYRAPRLPDGHVARSWTGETHWMRSRAKMIEYACHEGNYPCGIC